MGPTRVLDRPGVETGDQSRVVRRDDEVVHHTNVGEARWRDGSPPRTIGLYLIVPEELLSHEWLPQNQGGDEQQGSEMPVHGEAPFRLDAVGCPNQKLLRVDPPLHLIDAGDPTVTAGVGDVPEFDQRGPGFPRSMATITRLR